MRSRLFLLSSSIIIETDFNRGVQNVGRQNVDEIAKSVYSVLFVGLFTRRVRYSDITASYLSIRILRLNADIVGRFGRIKILLRTTVGVTFVQWLISARGAITDYFPNTENCRRGVRDTTEIFNRNQTFPIFRPTRTLIVPRSPSGKSRDGQRRNRAVLFFVQHARPEFFSILLENYRDKFTSSRRFFPNFVRPNEIFATR